MSLSSYLASKYLTASTAPSDPSDPFSKPSKKRKRKAAASGLIIADDDEPGWSASKVDDDDEGRPLTVTSGSAEFRKAKKNAWKTVGVPVVQPSAQNDDEDAANRIIAGVAAENDEATKGDEDPTVEDEDGILKMGDGTHAGLQSAASVSAQYAKRKREEAKRLGGGKTSKEEETVYRDATGRRIDISMRRKEAQKEALEKERAEAEELEAQKGDVQLRDKQRRKEMLEEAKFMPLARGIDDEEMNREMKEQDRWDDPALRFLVSGKEKKTKSGKPIYQGAAAPNRYGIRPGHRWDGVDRSIGFESKRYKAQNRVVRNKDLSHNWEMDT